jgi:hypothetical protein
MGLDVAATPSAEAGSPHAAASTTRLAAATATLDEREFTVSPRKKGSSCAYPATAWVDTPQAAAPTKIW